MQWKRIIDEMKDFVRKKLQEMNMPEHVIAKAIDGLHHLGRWIGRSAYSGS